LESSFILYLFFFFFENMSAFELKLDASQKVKLHAVIASHLSKISAYTDDVLPEYVMVLVQNKKTLAQVSTDLNAFLGKDAASFSEWLWDLLDEFVKGKPLPSLDSKEVSDRMEEEQKQEIPKAKKIASVITAPSQMDESEQSNNSRRSSRNGRGRESKNNRGRGERRYEKEDKESDEMEEESTKPAVSSVIATPETEKRPPPKELNLTSRLVLNAVKQAVDDTKESPKSPTESPKIKKPGFVHKNEEDVNVTIIVDGSKITKKRGSWEVSEEEETEGEKNKKLKQVKCQYWPNCKRGEACIYHHPKERCKNYRTCPYGNNCLYIHPLSEISCKFGKDCTRSDCTFVHPSTVPCKNGFACYLWNGSNCSYVHPQEACKFGDKCTKQADCTYSHATLCKFGSRCNRQGCTFAHSMSSKPTRMSQTPCKYGVNCKNKDSCNYVHPDDEEPVDTSNISDSLPQTPPKSEETATE